MNDLYATRMVQTETAERRRKAAEYRTARAARRLGRRGARSRPTIAEAFRAWRSGTPSTEQASPC